MLYQHFIAVLLGVKVNCPLIALVIVAHIDVHSAKGIDQNIHPRHKLGPRLVSRMHEQIRVRRGRYRLPANGDCSVGYLGTAEQRHILPLRVFDADFALGIKGNAVIADDEPLHAVDILHFHGELILSELDFSTSGGRGQLNVRAVEFVIHFLA